MQKAFIVALSKRVSSSFIIGNRSKSSFSSNRLFPTTNTFKSKQPLFNSFSKNNCYNFSSQSHHSHHKHSHSHHHPKTDPIVQMRKQFETLSSELQKKHPDSPEIVIRQLYNKCQQFIGENKRVEILIMFEVICEYIEAKNLVQTYSTFLIMSANNSFLMGKYQQVQRRCKLALPHEIKKHGEKHKNIGDIYNMLGISVSKLGQGKGQQALEYLGKALAIRKELYGQSGQAAQSLFNAGIVEEECQNMFQKAQANYLDAVQMLENCNIPNPLLYLKAKLRLAEIQLKLHNSPLKYVSDLLRMEELLQKFKTEKKFQKHEQAGIDMFLSLLHRNLGRKYFELGQYAKSLKFFEHCLVYLRQNKLQNQDRIRVLESCAVAHVQLQEYDKAVKLLQEAEKILDHYPANDQYKFQLAKYHAQLYKKVRDFQKELKLLQKIIKLLKNTKEQFAQPADLLETQLALIYCLGNLKKYDQVIKIGSQSLKHLQTSKSTFPKSDLYQDFKSNIIGYVGYAYLSKGEYDTALEHFERSEQIFTELASNPSRLQYHSSILRKISLIYMQVKKDFAKAFFYLEKHRQLILNEKSMPPQKKLNDLVVLLLDYEINDQQHFEKLIKVGYIDSINRVVDDILQVTKTIAATPQSKQILQQYYILIDSINQIYSTFATSQQYDSKVDYAIKARNLLKEMIQSYETVFAQEVKEVQQKTFKGDETLGQIIDRVLNVKKELEKNQ